MGLAGSKPLRAFVAIDVPDGVRAELRDLLGRFDNAGADVRWTRPENFHLTLRFLGDAPAEKLDAFSASLERHCAAGKTFRIRFGGVGAFPSIDRPRVIWAGVTEGVEPLASLAAGVDTLARKAGFAGEDRPFAGHLTLGRVRSGRNLPRLFRAIRSVSFESTPFEVESLRLYRSDLSSDGPIYTLLESFALKTSL